MIKAGRKLWGEDDPEGTRQGTGGEGTHPRRGVEGEEQTSNRPQDAGGGPSHPQAVALPPADMWQ